LKNHEKEAFLKSFMLFFLIGLVFLFVAMYQHYYKKLHDFDMQIESKIIQCHLNSSCKSFKISKVLNIKDKKLHQLYKDSSAYILFRDKSDFKKIEMPVQTYISDRKIIIWHVTKELFVYFILLVLFSIFFAYYTIGPFKKALKLNEEFVKDILHDFNTPLSSLKINLKILEKKFGKDEAIERSSEAIKGILSLQENLRYFLNKNRFESETLDLKFLLGERVEYFHSIYPSIAFINKVKITKIYTNKTIFIRIVDNIIGNACKYNKQNGSIQISFAKKSLYIEDSGIGINNSKKIFERGYKEGNIGTGIGLHIVQKLCRDLHIPIKVKSTLDIGTVFILDLKNILR
jgi:signal transduction histidine kinase